MKNLRKTIHTRKNKRINKLRVPFSAVVTIALLFATFLTIVALQQQQYIRSSAQTEPPVQQECKADTPLTEQQAGKIELFCTQFPDAEICKGYCTRTDANPTKTALCQPGGVYHCEAATGQPEKGKCQQGACTTSTRTGSDTYCGGGGSCCEPPHPAGGTCASGDKKECMAGLECVNNTCTEPPPPPPPAPGGGAPAPGGGGAPAPKETCASVKGTCKARSACTGTVRTGLCPGGANNICCIGGGGPAKKLPNGSRCTTHNQCTSGYCQDTQSGSGGLGGTCRTRPAAPAKKLNGAPCNFNSECQSNQCKHWGSDPFLKCGPIKAI